MSIVDMHADLISELESALDVSKMLSVFTSVVGILREQQMKIDELSSRIKDYEFNYANNDNDGNNNNMLSSDVLLPRLEDIEKRLNDFEAAVKGNGIVDEDLLNAREISPYLAFQNPIFETTTNDESDASSYKLEPEDSLSATSSFKSLPEHDFDEASFDPSIEMKEIEEMPSIFSEEPILEEEEEDEEEDEIIEPKTKLAAAPKKKKQIVEEEDDDEEEEEPVRVIKKKTKTKKPVVIVEEEEEEDEEEEDEEEPEPIIIKKVIKKEKPPKEPKKPVIVEEEETEHEGGETEESEVEPAKIPSKHSSRASSAKKTPRDEIVEEPDHDPEVVQDDEAEDLEAKVPSNRSSRKPSPVSSKSPTPPRVASRPPSAKPTTQTIEEEEAEPEGEVDPEVQPQPEPPKSKKEVTNFVEEKAAPEAKEDSQQPINWKRISKIDRRARKTKGGKHHQEDDEDEEEEEDIGERPTSAPQDHDHVHTLDQHARFLKTASTEYVGPATDSIVSFELPDNVTINKKKYKQKKPIIPAEPEPEPVSTKILDLSGVALPVSSSSYGDSVDRTTSEFAFKRRQMSLANLPFLTQNRLKKIVKKLKNRGRFMRISRDMLEERRKKYSQQSLKQKIDYLEADLIRTQQLVNKLREVHKKDHIVLKEGFSYFNAQINALKTQMYSNQHNLEQMVKGTGQVTPAMLANLDLFFGQLTQKTGGISNFFSTFTSFMEQFGPLVNPQLWQQLANQDKENQNSVNNPFLQNLTQYVKLQVIIPETTSIQNTLYEQIAHLRTLSDNVITKQDMNNMLKLPTDHSSAGGYGTGNTDGNHQKLVNIINKILFANQERMDLIIEEKMKKTTHSLGMGQNVATYANTVTTHDLEKHDLHLQQLVQHKINELKDDLDRIDNNHILRVHHVEEDITFMKEKLTSLDHYREENNQELEKLEKARQQETEQLRILQKRIANLSIDKLLDDLKSVHKALQERPSVDQVTDMIDGIEMTFKEHLGENVQGLKSLVNQVYRHIQHKVDREDIRKLIAARLAQMEKEILNREEELYNIASSTTTRCLSCGQLPRESWQVGMGVPSHSIVAGNGAAAARPVSKHRRSASPTGVTGSGASSPPMQRPSVAMQPMDDEINSITSEPQHPNRTAGTSFLTSSEPVLNPYSQGQTNDVYALLTGQAGLRPIQLQHAPMQPIKEPHLGRPTSSTVNMNANTTVVATNKKKSNSEKIPEPLYRKAKMTAHMKEMVKVQAAGMDTYGYNHLNPLYVLEGSVLEQPSVSSIGGGLVPGGALEGPNMSIYSSSGGSISARDNGGSRTMATSQSLTNLPNKPVGPGLFSTTTPTNRPPSSATANNINALRQGISIPLVTPTNPMANSGKRVVANDTSPIVMDSPVVRTGGQRNSLILGNSAVPFDPDLVISKARLNQV